MGRDCSRERRQLAAARARTPRSRSAAHTMTNGTETAAPRARRGRGRAAAAMMLPSYPPCGSASKCDSVRPRLARCRATGPAELCGGLGGSPCSFIIPPSGVGCFTGQTGLATKSCARRGGGAQHRASDYIVYVKVLPRSGGSAPLPEEPFDGRQELDAGRASNHSPAWGRRRVDHMPTGAGRTTNDGGYHQQQWQQRAVPGRDPGRPTLSLCELLRPRRVGGSAPSNHHVSRERPRGRRGAPSPRAPTRRT